MNADMCYDFNKVIKMTVKISESKLKIIAIINNKKVTVATMMREHNKIVENNRFVYRVRYRLSYNNVIRHVDTMTDAFIVLENALDIVIPAKAKEQYHAKCLLAYIGE